MILFIYFCIFLLNAVAIFLTYHFLGKELEKKQKGIFVIIGIAVMYLTVTLIYWLSTQKINLGEAASMGQNLITFTFVPVNAILVLPFFASSYRYFQLGKLQKTKWRNRCILLAIVLLLLLVIEFFYFKEIQTGILNMVQRNQ